MRLPMRAAATSVRESGLDARGSHLSVAAAPASGSEPPPGPVAATTTAAAESRATADAIAARRAMSVTEAVPLGHPGQSVNATAWPRAPPRTLSLLHFV